MAKTIGPDEYEHWEKFIRDETEDDQKLVDDHVKKFQTSNSTFPNYGWVCPVCGRGLSPYTSVCPCKGFDPGWKVTC